MLHRRQAKTKKLLKIKGDQRNMTTIYNNLGLAEKMFTYSFFYGS